MVRNSTWLTSQFPVLGTSNDDEQLSVQTPVRIEHEYELELKLFSATLGNASQQPMRRQKTAPVGNPRNKFPEFFAYHEMFRVFVGCCDGPGTPPHSVPV